MKTLVIHREAIAELDAAMSWYEAQHKGLGLELHAEVRNVMDEIKHAPDVGTRYKNTYFRFRRTNRFPYLVYYLEHNETVWIAAIAHGRRRPDYWRRRRPE